MRHAHPVHFGQDVEREVALQIQGLEPGEPVAASVLELFSFKTEGIVMGESLKRLFPEQPLFVLESEQRYVIQAPFHLRQREMPQEVSASHALGHQSAEQAEQAPYASWDKPETPLPSFDQVFIVSGKEFVTAVA